MELPMEQLLYLIAGAALTWAFYFLQRRVERRGTVDAIERNQKLLDLLQDLDGAEVSLDDLQRFEARLIGNAETAVRIADQYFTRAEDIGRQSAAAESSEVELDQAALDRQAVESFQRADAHLRELVVHLRAQLDGEALARFEQAHASWLDYREHYAGFIAQCYSGGAIRPLIHAVTLESISWAWISELETQLGDGAGDEDD
jgi:hypothetical protein